jgi:hypothetical protein
MDQVIRVLLNVPRHSIVARLLCMQKANELEKLADVIRKQKGDDFLESVFHYSLKLHCLSLISNYLLDPESKITESEFITLISKLEDVW